MALHEAVLKPSSVEACLASLHAAIEAGEDVNAPSEPLGFTPLHLAAVGCPSAAVVTAAVQTLVEAGANVRAKNSLGQVCSRFGQ